MTGFRIPRYFVGNAGAEEDAFSDFPLLHVVDSFFVGSRHHLVEREWIVAVDQAGELRATPGENRSALPEALQNELAFNEISRGQPSRLIEAVEVYLFNLQVVEQVVADSPGLNDPVYLYGTLCGLENQESRIEGQLTVTRGDLLNAVLTGASYAFRYHETFGAQSSRCFHLMLPGDTEEEIRRGAGIVLAYPLFPAELLATVIANESILNQLIYDILSKLKDDLKRERAAHPLTSSVLPVPNRAAVKLELESQGYKIEGDRAVRETGGAGGAKGFLASVFGAFSAEDELVIPREGKTDEFLALAHEAFYTLQKSLATSRVIALRNCLNAAPHKNYRAYSANSANDPVEPASHRNPVSRPAKKIKIPGNRSSDWVNDFISAHRTNESESKITSTLEIKPPIISGATPKSKKEKQKEWREDFAENSAPASKTNTKDKTAFKPDWMKDFE